MKTNLSIDIANDEYWGNIIVDFNRIKHLLITGNSGSGKSVLLHRIASALIENNPPGKMFFVFIDIKKIEFSIYSKAPQLLTPIINDPRKAILVMKWAYKEIQRRLEIFKNEGCNNIQEYDGKEDIPHIFIFIDEFYDVMNTYPDEAEQSLLKLLRMGHIVGVHTIFATSSFSKKILTKDILASTSTRVALQTSSSKDSKIAIGTDQASMLRGEGDMLYREGSKYVIRGKVKATPQKTIKELIRLLANKHENYGDLINLGNSDPEEKDSLFEEAKMIVLQTGQASTSFLQRKLGIGYSRAASIIDQLERAGVIGPSENGKPRKILLSSGLNYL